MSTRYFDKYRSASAIQAQTQAAALQAKAEAMQVQVDLAYRKFHDVTPKNTIAYWLTQLHSDLPSDTIEETLREHLPELFI